MIELVSLTSCRHERCHPAELTGAVVQCTGCSIETHAVRLLDYMMIGRTEGPKLLDGSTGACGEAVWSVRAWYKHGYSWLCLAINTETAARLSGGRVDSDTM